MTTPEPRIVTVGGDELEVIEDRHPGYSTITRGDHPLLGVCLLKDGKRGAVIALDIANAKLLHEALGRALGEG